MAVVPLLMSLAREIDSMNEWDHYLDDDFGFGLHPMEIFRPRVSHGGTASALLNPRRRHLPYDRNQILTRRAARLAAKGADGVGGGGGDAVAVPTIGKDGFQVSMDVSQFKPNELTVKTVDKNIIVEGKHEEREDDHGLIQRHFIRKYTLPKDYEPKEVVSTISSDGVLTVKAPPPPNKATKQTERIVQIQHTGPAHLSVKAPEPDSGKSNGDKETTVAAK